MDLWAFEQRLTKGFLGSESKFIVPLARPPGAMLCIAMKLASDPNNPFVFIL